MLFHWTLNLLILPLFTFNNLLMSSPLSLHSSESQLPMIIFHKNLQLSCSLFPPYHPAKSQSWVNPDMTSLCSYLSSYMALEENVQPCWSIDSFTVNSLLQISKGSSLLPNNHIILPLSSCTSFLKCPTGPTHVQLMTLPQNPLGARLLLPQISTQPDIIFYTPFLCNSAIVSSLCSLLGNILCYASWRKKKLWNRNCCFFCSVYQPKYTCIYPVGYSSITMKGRGPTLSKANVSTQVL